MKKSVLLIATLTLALCSSRHALALCGDVNGDNNRTASDALAVLRAAVGQPGELTCVAETGPSKLRYYNDFTCNEGSSVSEARFDGFTFTADGGQTSEYQTVDRVTIDTIELDLCGGTYGFDGPLNLPPNRSITFFMVFADPAVYGTAGGTPAFFVMIDDGEPAAALKSGALPPGGSEIGVSFGRLRKTAP